MSDRGTATVLIPTLKQELRERRDEIRNVHDRGLSGAQVSAKLASLTDAIIVRLFDASLESAPDARLAQARSNLALVCLGSHARRQCAPYSDVDLMILYQGLSRDDVAELLRPLTQGVYDIGLQLGSSIRKPTEAVQLARDDAVICTSQIDARFLTGNQNLFQGFRSSFEQMVSRASKSLCKAFLLARAEERDQFGESVYLLEPHVKRSRGGLRDHHLLRWLAFSEFGQADPDRLLLIGALSKFDHHRLLSAAEFLLRLRNEMHFHAGSSADMLSRAEQLRIAGWLSYQPTRGLLPVEQFMRDYFHHTNHVWQMVRRREASLIGTTTASRVLDPFFAKTVEGDFRIGLKNISATTTGLAKVKTDLGDVLRLVRLAAEENKPLDQPTYSALLLAAPDFPDEASPELRQRFYDMLAEPAFVGAFLKLLHELGYLDKFIPAMRHARCLLQFNQYHKYTVDEHSLRAVAEAARFVDRDDRLGKAYRSLRDKRIIHLALLLHDLGKGFEEDHSEVGKRIAEETTQLLQIDGPAAQDIVYLVHKHLALSHLAFRRDTSDLRVLEAFARQVGTELRLQMLFVLSCADLAAVGPDVLTDWKLDVLTSVYLRTASFLQDEDISDVRKKLTELTAAVLKLLTHEQLGDSWYVDQLDALPSSHLTAQDPSRVVETLHRLRSIPFGSASAWCDYHAGTKTIECLAGVSQGLGRGVFSSMAGALSGEGLEILSADIDVLADDLMLVRYTAIDSLSVHEVTPERLATLAQQMIASLHSDQPPRFRRVFGREKEEESRKLTALSNEVRIDTTLSDQYTIVEVFTVDRRGLLYSLARKIHELELVIRHAKIGTYLDQVVDVFYVTNRDEMKVTDQQTLEQLKRELMHVIDAQ